MKKILLRVSLLCVLSIASSAQTLASSAQTYYQVQPQTCILGTYYCNGIPLRVPLDHDAAYSFGGSNTGIVVGGPFAVVVNDKNVKTGENGKITHIVQQAPPLRKGNHGRFEFGFSLLNGQTGTVTGQITVMQVCRRYCWSYAIVESSTVVIY